MVTKTLNLEWTRGDTQPLGIKVKGGTPDEINFSVKRDYKDIDYIIQKTLENGIVPADPKQGDPEGLLRYILTVDPADTEGLSSGMYCYDLEMVINGTVGTMYRGNITLDPDVTRHLTGEV